MLCETSASKDLEMLSMLHLRPGALARVFMVCALRCRVKRFQPFFRPPRARVLRERGVTCIPEVGKSGSTSIPHFLIGNLLLCALLCMYSVTILLKLRKFELCLAKYTNYIGVFGEIEHFPAENITGNHVAVE